MKIKFIAEEDLIIAKENYASICREIIMNNSTSLALLLRNDNIIKSSSIEIEEFHLDLSQSKPSDTDFENIKRIYTHMKGLSESQASDERIWVAYTLSEGLDYMKYRWLPEHENDKFDRYFFKGPKDGNSKRPLFRNGFARLWWIGYHTYDSKRVNPFELTEFIVRDQDYINNLLEIGFASNPIISKAVISALLDAEKNGVIVNRHLVRSISQYVNLLGGIYLLDCLSYEDIYCKIKKKIGF